jgi:putative ABC transport system permease protein
MTVVSMALREMLHRKVNLGLGLLSVAVAVACLTGATTVLLAHDAHTERILAEKEAEMVARMAELKDSMRKSMLKLGFNVVILPEGQELSDWYADDYATKYMPDSYVDKLADSGVISVRHFLPSLQQKITWPEHKRKIILVGTRGEVPNLHKSVVKPMVQPVPAGTIVLGHELHQSLGLAVGDTTKLMGREFKVHLCHEERGTKDDISAWISLSEAQALLNKEGLINAILALECLCVGEDALPRIRSEIAAVLPGTQVIERGSRVLARWEARSRVGREARDAIEGEKANRAELRMSRERFAAILVPIVMVGCAVWICLLGYTNVRDRRSEIGILRAMGFRSRQIMLLFLLKSLTVGAVGGAVGFLVGSPLGAFLASVLDDVPDAPGLGGLGTFVLAMAVASSLSVVAGWIPAMLAARDDPAAILNAG